MPTLVTHPAQVAAAGTLPKIIREYVGRAATGTPAVSVARMSSPAGWSEPGQRPEFDEVTLVLEGAVNVEHEGGVLVVRAGEAVVTRAGEWIRYGTPEGAAEYVAVCVPAFSPETVHRDESDAAPPLHPGARGLAPGTRGVAVQQVGAEDLASRLAAEPGEGFPEVYATSRMIALCERAAANALRPLLHPGELSVGVRVDVRHTAPTAAGEEVQATARFTG